MTLYTRHSHITYQYMYSYPYPLPKVAPLFIVIPAFVAHLFLLPYKKLWQNVIETVLLINYTLLFLLRATPVGISGRLNVLYYF